MIIGITHWFNIVSSYSPLLLQRWRICIHYSYSVHSWTWDWPSPYHTQSLHLAKTGRNSVQKYITMMLLMLLICACVCVCVCMCAVSELLYCNKLCIVCLLIFRTHYNQVMGAFMLCVLPPVTHQRVMYLFFMLWAGQQNDDGTLWLPHHPPEVIGSVLHWSGYECIMLLVALNDITGIQIVNYTLCTVNCKTVVSYNFSRWWYHVKNSQSSPS